MPTILVVDDEADAREFVARFLEQQGFAVRTADDGREALAFLLNHGADAVVLDVRMPRMDGISLLEVLRSYLRWHSLPVVLLTAHATEQQADRARSMGRVEVMYKSNLTLSALADTLRRMIPPAHTSGGGAA